jgi:hypothetical protein
MNANPSLQPPLAYTWLSIQQCDIPAMQKMLGDQEAIHFVKLLY